VHEWKSVLKLQAGLAGSLLLAIIAVVATAALAFAMLLWEQSGRPVGEWFWWTFLLILIAGMVAMALAGIAAIRAFLPRFREQRFLAHRRSEGAKAPEEGGGEEQRQLREKMLEAIRTLQKSPDLRKKGGMPLYTVPWYLLIGASQSGKTTLLRSVANSFAPFARPPSSVDAPTQNCDWWFFNTAIILDTAGSYAFPAKGEPDSTQWYRFLQVLRSYRELQPINGLIIAVAADRLASKRQEELRVEATELRKRIDEAIRVLGVDFPIYLLITQCDLIDGFTEFFGCLPEHTSRQALGYVHETRPQVAKQQPHPVTTLHFESISETFVERLKQLRLSIFNEEKLPPATLHQKIFCFPEEFRAFQQPLRTFVETILAENPFQHLPLFRGIFFSSAQQQGAPYSFLRRQLHVDGQIQIRPAEGATKTYFLHDLFAVILPRDQYLVKSTGKAIKGRLFRHLFGFGSCLALSILLVLFFTQAFLSDRKVRASTNQELCAASGGGQGTGHLLEQADGCRRAVQTLIEQNRQRSAWTKLLFNRSSRLERQLRQRYVEKFDAEVLAPLDAGISQRLIAGSETIPLVFLLIKRIELINQCLWEFRCPDPIDKDMRPDYQLMLDTGGQQRPSPGQVATLQNTYETYLHWSSGSEEVLRREQETHADRLRRWFSSRQFAPRQILLWANQNYAPLSSQALWAGFQAAEGGRALQVEGAYTPGAWKQSILPFLQRAGEAVPDTEPLLKEFQAQYRAQYFEQWRRFLAEFPSSELPLWRTREQRRKLALRLLDASSPYNRILDLAFEHLKPLLPSVLATGASPTGAPEDKLVQQPARLLGKVWQRVSQFWRKGQKGEPGPEKNGAVAMAEPAVPPWVQVLQHYISSESRRAYLDSLKLIREQLAGDVPLEKSFQLAQAGFQEGKPTEKSTQPVLKAWWIIGQFREKEGSGDESVQKTFWPLLERPVLIAWKVVLEEAGEFLQKSWTENVLAPTRGLSEMEQVDFLYGPQGKVREFVGQFAKPFLADNESRLGQLLGEEVPLGPNFFKALRDERQLKPILEMGRRNPHQVGVQATRESVIDSQTSVVEEKTEFLLECESKTFKINNRPKDPAEASTTVFWSSEGCGDAVITILMSCDRRCVERAASVGIPVQEASSLRITKRYKGQGGFLRFIQDFSAGWHGFGSSDFADGEEALRKYRVMAIRVFYQVNVPPTLAKLMSLVPGSMTPPAIIK
jgi:type VI secretion system protein ImpL